MAMANRADLCLEMAVRGARPAAARALHESEGRCQRA
jgi:hypothetical protein